MKARRNCYNVGKNEGEDRIHACRSEKIEDVNHVEWEYSFVSDFPPSAVELEGIFGKSKPRKGFRFIFHLRHLLFPSGP